MKLKVTSIMLIICLSLQTSISAVAGEVQTDILESKVTIEEDMVSLKAEEVTYAGKGKSTYSEVVVSNNETNLEQDKDYIVQYEECDSVGQGNVIVTGIGDYEGTVEKSYSILPKDVNNDEIMVEVDGEECFYDEQEKRPDICVYDDGEVMEEDTDYKIVYTDNQQPGTAVIRIEGMGNYQGYLEKTFEISLGKVEGMAVTKQNTDSVSISWEPVAGATSYRVFYKTPAETVYEQYFDVDENSAEITGLSSGTDWRFKVRAIAFDDDEMVMGKASDMLSASTKPQVPQITDIYGEKEKITLEWSHEGECDGYNIYMSDFASGTYKLIDTVKADKKKYERCNLEGDSQYYFKVQAYKNSDLGVLDSGMSSYKYAVADTTIPVMGEVVGGINQIRVSWGEIDKADGYEIFMSSDKNKNFKRIATVGKSNTLYIKKELDNACDYYCMVRAYKEKGGVKQYSRFSSIKMGTTATKTPTISEVEGGKNSVVVKWNQVLGADGYILYQSDKENGTYQKVAMINGNVCSYVVPKLKENGDYYFKLRTYRNGNEASVCSGYSSCKYGGTAVARPVMTKIVGAQNKVYVSWDKVAGADGYELFMKEEGKATYSRVLTADKDTCSYWKTNLSTAKDYYFIICAYRFVNGKKVYSEFSTPHFATTCTLPPKMQYAVGSDNNVILKWDEVENADGYVIYMAKMSGGKYSKVAAIGPTTTSYKVTGLDYNKYYYFKVNAFRKGEGEGTAVGSPYSEYVWCTTSSEVPEITNIADSGNGEIEVFWQDVVGETRYELWMAEEKEGEYERVTVNGTNQTSCIISDLEKGKEYYFKVRSCRIADLRKSYSSFSEVVEIIVE